MLESCGQVQLAWSSSDESIEKAAVSAFTSDLAVHSSYSCVQHPFTPCSELLVIQWDRSKIFTLVLNYSKKQMQQLPLKAIARWTLNGGRFLLLLSVQGALLLLAVSARSLIAVDHFCSRLLCVHMAVCGECKDVLGLCGKVLVVGGLL